MSLCKENQVLSCSFFRLCSYTDEHVLLLQIQTPLQHVHASQIQKPFTVGLRTGPWKFANAQVKFK